MWDTWIPCAFSRKLCVGRRSHQVLGRFNPHQIMSFASPLGVGVTSGGEYMDIELKEVIDPGQAMDALNGAMVEGVRILDFFYLPKDSENAMSSVKAAAYRLSYKHPEQCPFSLREMEVFLRDFYTIRRRL